MVRTYSFTKKKGQNTLICFRDIGFQKLLDTDWSRKGKGKMNELTDLVARYLRDELRQMDYVTDCYPPLDSFFSGVTADIPEPLKRLLDIIILEGKKIDNEALEMKRDAIAHAKLIKLFCIRTYNPMKKINI